MLELEGIGPGPLACCILADFGADVITISRAQARSGFEMDSAPTNAVEKHARLRVLESRTNAAG